MTQIMADNKSQSFDNDAVPQSGVAQLPQACYLRHPRESSYLASSPAAAAATDVGLSIRDNSFRTTGHQVAATWADW